MALLPAVSLAWYLSTQHAELLSQEKLSLWIIGAELIDARDEGKWYSCLSPMLDIADIQVTLIGPGLSEDSGAEAIFRGAAEEYLQKDGVNLPDVAVIFQPGFEEEESLLKSAVISRLLESGCMVIGSSYSEEEYQRDRLMADAYAYALTMDQNNPFALDPGSTGLRWADRMWSFSQQQIPSEEALKTPNTALIESVQTLSRMVAHSRLQGIWAQPAPPGSGFQIPDKRGGSRTMFHVMDSYYLDPASGRIYGVEEGHLRPTDREVKPEDINALPVSGDPMEEALWAAGIKNKYLVTQRKPTH